MVALLMKQSEKLGATFQRLFLCLKNISKQKSVAP